MTFLRSIRSSWRLLPFMASSALMSNLITSNSDKHGWEGIFSPLPAASSPESSIIYDPIALPQQRLEALSAMSRKSVLAVDLFDTPAHRELSNLIITHAARLHANDFVNSNGSHARLILGPKGVGKSTMLRASAQALEAAFPSVIPIYVTCKAMGSSWHGMNRSCLMDIIANTLHTRGLAIDLTDPNKPSAIKKALLAANKRVLLMVDEIDELYRCTPEEDTFKTAGHSLHDLAFLGDDPSGLFGVFVCGSSTACPLLIAKKLTADAALEFPRYKGAPHLNSTKFSSVRITAPIPTDLNIVQHILERGCGDRIEDNTIVRLIAFTAGARARRVVECYKTMRSGQRAGQDPVRWTLETWSPSSHETFPASLINHYPFYSNLIATMREYNDALDEELVRFGALQVSQVMHVDWEKKFKPLPWSEVVKVWQETHVDDEAKARDVRALQAAVMALCDKDLLLYTSIHHGNPRHLYPSTMIQVFANNCTVDEMTTFANSVLPIVKGFLVENVAKLPAVIVDKAIDRFTG